MSVYPTPTGQRMAYDRDGTAMIWFQTGGGITTPTLLSNAKTRLFNQEAVQNVGIGTGTSGFIQQFNPIFIVLIFPEQRDVYEYFFSGLGHPGGITSGTFQWSNDTTTGADGTWTTLENPMAWTAGPVSTSYRSSFHTLSSPLVSVKAIRWQFSVSNDWEQDQIHVYGQPSAGANPDSLRCWQPVTNAEVTTVEDYGDIPRAVGSTKTFRIKNVSATKTATSISVSAEALTDASPSLLGQYLFSTDNISYTASINIGTLAPGAVSAVLYVRDNVDAGAQVSVWALRGVAVPVSFS